MSEKLSRVEFVRKKYRLSEMTVIEQEINGKQLGDGPIMAEETLQRFIDGDPSGNHKYLDWMLFQAGGGQETMEKSLSLWDGEGPNDAQSLRNQCREDFIDEHIKGYVDENGVRHRPITRGQAEKEWEQWQERGKFEFVMGDQDVAYEDGYGFYRHWPGKDEIYQRIVNSIALWHTGLPKLKAQNERLARYLALKSETTTRGQLTDEDRYFLKKYDESPVARMVELDIYKGWQPNSYDQSKAVYKNLEDLLNAVADLRRQQVLADVRHEIVCEDENLIAVAPLTVGASLKFGSIKWCTANRTDFDRSFDGRQNITHNWKSYTFKGPLVYVRFKVPMPEYLSMIALHVQRKEMRSLSPPWRGINFVDMHNQSGGTGCDAIRAKITAEHAANYAHARQATSDSDEKTYRWAGRTPGRAWTDPEVGKSVLLSFDSMLAVVSRWSANFNMNRIVADHLTDASAKMLDAAGNEDA